METILLGTTVVALIIALVMSVVAARLSRQERMRSSARAAALSAAAGIQPVPVTTVEEEPRRAPWAPRLRSAQAATPAAARAIGFDMREARAADVAPAPLVAPAVVGSIELPLQQGFLSAPATPRTSSGGQRFLAVAAAILFVVLATGFIWQWSSSRDTSASAVVDTGTPLELVSLRHDRQSSKLSVSGLVRNPVAGKPVEHLSAVVFLFDSEGTFVTSARALVDFLTLGSGDESPFVVTLDAPATVARYRVSFRTDEGIVSHIDRRGAPPIESAELRIKNTEGRTP